MENRQELYQRKTYTMPIPFLFNTYIREYDISKANINILLSKGIIDRTMYDKLYQSPRDVRQYTIGMLLRQNEKYKEILENGFCEYRKLFIESNSLEEKDILSIKNDAFFIINKIPKNRIFGNIEFRESSVFTSYMSLNNNRLELYYKPSKIGEDSFVEVKGISDKKIIHHRDYMVDFILYIFDMLENGDLKSLITSFETFYHQYINRQLDVRFYREFNTDSEYAAQFIINGNIQRRNYNSDEMALQSLPYLDITYNMYLLREMFKYISSLYFNNKTTRR